MFSGSSLAGLRPGFGRGGIEAKLLAGPLQIVGERAVGVGNEPGLMDNAGARFEGRGCTVGRAETCDRPLEVGVELVLDVRLRSWSCEVVIEGDMTSTAIGEIFGWRGVGAWKIRWI